MMWDKLKNALGVTPKIVEEKAEKTQEEVRREALEAEKEAATKAGEPWVAVLDTQINPENIRNGFFELDWNNEFIEQLLDAGYQGESPEEIVDAWFKTLARQMLEEDGVNSDRDMGHIKVVPMKNGKSEVS